MKVTSLVLMLAASAAALPAPANINRMSHETHALKRRNPQTGLVFANIAKGGQFLREAGTATWGAVRGLKIFGGAGNAAKGTTAAGKAGTGAKSASAASSSAKSAAVAESQAVSASQAAAAASVSQLQKTGIQQAGAATKPGIAGSASHVEAPKVDAGDSLNAAGSIVREKPKASARTVATQFFDGLAIASTVGAVAAPMILAPGGNGAPAGPAGVAQKVVGNVDSAISGVAVPPIPTGKRGI